MRFTTILLVVLSTLSLHAAELQDGDIVFQCLPSRQGDAIAAATHSTYTHVGLVLIDDGKPYVYEAVQPVVRTALTSWINRGERKHYVIKRLKDRSKLDVARLKEQVKPMLGKNYDALFEWSDDRIYCSELVWKAYERATGLHLGELRSLRDFDLEHDNVKKIMKERYGQNIPLDMKVIAPSDIFDSALLVTVETK